MLDPRNCSGIPETSVLESRRTRFHTQSSGVQESRRTVFQNPGGSKLRSVPESGIPESVRNPGGSKSRNPGVRNPGECSGIPESWKLRNLGKACFRPFVGCYRRAGGMKISTVVSTLFRGLPRLSEVVKLLRDNNVPG